MPAHQPLLIAQGAEWNGLEVAVVRPALGVHVVELVITRLAQQAAGGDVHQVLFLFLRELADSLTQLLNTNQKEDGVEVGPPAEAVFQSGQQLVPAGVKVEFFVFEHGRVEVVFYTCSGQAEALNPLTYMVFRTNLFNDLLALFYPDLCLACEEALVGGEQDFCTDCRVKLPYLNHHQPNPAVAAEASPLLRRFWGKVPVHHALAYLRFAPRGKVQRLLHRLKYDNHPEIGTTLGRWFGSELAQLGYQAEFDALVPVPMHPTKERRRGYNQAACFAEGLGEGLGLPVMNAALRKLDDTASQTRKNRLERWENVGEGFDVPDPATIAAKRLLLVDDVLTTGATLEACASVVLAAGAGAVSVITIAAAGD